VSGNPEAIGTFVATVTGANTFTIPVSGGSQTGTGGAWRLVGATNASPVQITSYEHSLVNGASVTISNVTGNSAANGNFTITRVDDHRFTLNSTTGTGNGRNGSWTSSYWADREHGALLRSSGVHVENANFYYIPGTCLVVATGNGPGNRNGQILPFDSEKARIWNCQFARGYRGAEIAMVDALVGRLNGFGLRDFGVKFVYGSAQIDGALHFYGIGEGTADGTAVWFASTAGPSWGGPIYAETSPIGLRLDSAGNKLTGFYSHTCYLRNLWIANERNSVENFEIEVLDGITELNGGEAVLVAAQSTTLANGTFGVTHPVPAGETAIRLRNGTRQSLDNISFVATDGSSAPLIRVQQPLNDSLIIARTFNGGTFLELYIVSADRAQGGTSTTIQLATSQDFSNDMLNGMTVTITGGPGNGESKTISDYDDATDTATISGTWTTTPTFASTYEVKADMVGQGNFIRLSTDDTITGPGINLGPNWGTTPLDQDIQKNDIRVDGIRYYYNYP
jgi:hypothetical protein